MYREQELGVIMLFTSISTTLIATGIQAYEALDTNTIKSVNITYGIAVFVLLYTGWHTFRIFHNSYHVSPEYIKKDKGMIAQSSDTVYSKIFTVFSSL